MVRHAERLITGPSPARSLAVSTRTPAGRSVRAIDKFRDTIRLGVRVFAQVIQGDVSDVAAAHIALDRWAQELAPEASGWLSSIAGVTNDGRFILLALFESDEAAQRNSERPEQSAWWTETSKLFSDQPTFRNSHDVTVAITGDLDRAGFVQIIQGRGELARTRELLKLTVDQMAAQRPEIIGSVAVEYDSAAYTLAIYFAPEGAALSSGSREPLPELTAQMNELMTALNIGEAEFFDLHQPWVYGPGAGHGGDP
jgi:hypothetical protein